MLLTTHATLRSIPDGPAGIIATLAVMGSMVKTYRVNMTVRETAMRLVKNCAAKDELCEITRVHKFVRDQVRYLGDVRDVETIQAPDYTLKHRAGDCDDKALLLACLLESIGYTTQFVAIGKEPGVYSHVYGEVIYAGHWLPLETTEPVELGWQPLPGIVRARYVQTVN